MLFSSIEFAVFLPVVFILYWFVANKSLKLQNSLLLLASYMFYACWDWRFLFLLIFLSLANYLLGLAIEKCRRIKVRKYYLAAGLLINLGILGVFKYYNFFVDAFIDLVSLFGYNLPESTIKILLPLGISFYVFLSLSYIIDIYKNNLNAERSILNVLITLSFFPILLAGPIQRPSSLLPQIKVKRNFDSNLAIDGLRQILWGLFAKVVIADNIATNVNEIFSNSSDYSGSTLLLGAILFTVQIYADFAGYSNIAIGTAKLFGFKLMQNFAYPYFSRDITEFWKKWHISLTTWFRDYVFLPLSFKMASVISNEKIGILRTDHFIYIIASIVTWLLTGLWHGANYTFVIWGLINGGLLIIYHLQNKPRKKMLKKLNIRNDNQVIIFFETLVTMTLVILSWIFFKADSLNDSVLFLNGIFSGSLFTVPEILPKKALFLVILFFMAEWLQRKKKHTLELENSKLPVLVKWSVYYLIIFLVLWHGGKSHEFIYFQF